MHSAYDQRGRKLEVYRSCLLSPYLHSVVTLLRRKINISISDAVLLQYRTILDENIRANEVFSRYQYSNLSTALNSDLTTMPGWVGVETTHSPVPSAHSAVLRLNAQKNKSVEKDLRLVFFRTTRALF